MADKEADPDPYRLFSYVLAEHAEVYVAVVEGLMAAKERFRLQLRPADVVAEFGPARKDKPEEIRNALEQLADWGNLTRFFDSAAPESLADFYAKRYLYQLTPEGVAAHEGVRAARSAGLDRGGRLSSVLLPQIIEKLHAVATAADHSLGHAPDAVRLYASLLDLFNVFAELADNAGRYMNDLAVETSDIAADDERFLAYKRAVFVYLDTFVARFTEAVPSIRDLVATLDPAMAELIPFAASADAAPTADGHDVGPVDVLSARWAGVRGWFLAVGDQVPVAEALRMAMLDALNRILSALNRLNDRHLRRASREADFSALAGWFAAFDDSESSAAAQLWDAAFGTYAARHLVHLAGDEEVDRRRSFWDAAPAEVAPRLRTTGTRAGPGRPGYIADYGGTKSAQLAMLRAARARSVAAASRLAARTPARLSEVAPLDADEFALLLDLLTATLHVASREDGTRRAVTTYATVVLTIDHDGATADIGTPSGTLHAPDFGIDVITSRSVRAGMHGAATIAERVNDEATA